ncbi:AAA family ATPase [Streptomyces sp. NPDC001530]|uniref:AAA family ATPase n=1 Tax=Streptomyces sp. NPDC001530 TaxID=3364582 RepID=UPI00368313C8
MPPPAAVPHTNSVRPHHAAATSRTRPGPQHYLSLPHATTIPTPTLDAVAHALEQTLAEQAVMCLYGDAGCGKTYALATTLACRPFHGPRICSLSPHPAPTPTALRAELLSALDISHAAGSDPGIQDALLRARLAACEHVLVVDEAHRLTTGCIEYLCYLLDDPDTQMAIVLIVGTGGIRLLRRQQLLASRSAVWLQAVSLTPDQVCRAIPRFHPLWCDSRPAVLERLDARFCHGNLRRWAQATHHALRLRRRIPAPETTVEDLVAAHLAHDDHE